MIPTLPLRIRNRLATTILAALADDGARDELVALARGDAATWLAPDERVHAAALTARARAASAVLVADPPAAVATVERALAAAARLFDAHLYFEVHELLEPFWHAATGQERDTLQGLIQVAVGYQHLANGNDTGARALLADGATKLHRRELTGMDLDPFARGVAESMTRLGAWDWHRVPRFPRRGRP